MNKVHILNRTSSPINVKSTSEHAEVCELPPRRKTLTRLSTHLLRLFSQASLFQRFRERKNHNGQGADHYP